MWAWLVSVFLHHHPGSEVPPNTQTRDLLLPQPQVDPPPLEVELRLSAALCCCLCRARERACLPFNLLGVNPCVGGNGLSVTPPLLAIVGGACIPPNTGVRVGGGSGSSGSFMAVALGANIDTTRQRQKTVKERGASFQACVCMDPRTLWVEITSLRVLVGNMSALHPSFPTPAESTAQTTATSNHMHLHVSTHVILLSAHAHTFERRRLPSDRRSQTSKNKQRGGPKTAHPSPHI